ncbi:hypothetical protein Tco_1076307 [Tanacetum coccineum]
MCATNGVPTQGLGRSIVSGEYGNCVWDDDGRGTPVILDFRNSAFNTMYGQTSGGVCYSGSEIGRGQMVLDFENSVVRLPGYENRFVQVEGCNDVPLFGYNDVRSRSLDDPYESFFRQIESVSSHGKTHNLWLSVAYGLSRWNFVVKSRAKRLVVRKDLVEVNLVQRVVRASAQCRKTCSVVRLSSQISRFGYGDNTSKLLREPQEGEMGLDDQKQVMVACVVVMEC